MGCLDGTKDGDKSSSWIFTGYVYVKSDVDGAIFLVFFF
jgi:hypothetical protein